MKFIVDAQLPKKLSDQLALLGYDSIHTSELELGNRTADSFITELSMKEQRIVISKDFDFYERYFQKLEPFKLLYVNTGNISTKLLLEIFNNNMKKIDAELLHNSVVELSRKSLITIL